MEEEPNIMFDDEDLKRLLIDHLKLENQEILRARALFTRVGPGVLATILTASTIIISIATSWTLLNYRQSAQEQRLERIAVDVGEIHDVMVAKGMLTPRGRIGP